MLFEGICGTLFHGFGSVRTGKELGIREFASVCESEALAKNVFSLYVLMCTLAHELTRICACFQVIGWLVDQSCQM